MTPCFAWLLSMYWFCKAYQSLKSLLAKWQSKAGLMWHNCDISIQWTEMLAKNFKFSAKK